MLSIVSILKLLLECIHTLTVVDYYTFIPNLIHALKFVINMQTDRFIYLCHL